MFCKGSHAPTDCIAVTDPEQRRDSVKNQRLCFNCLGQHKSSQCTSRYRCRKCQRKHHTSICPGPKNSDSPGNTQRSDTPPRPSNNPSIPPNIPPSTSTALHLTTVSTSTSALHLTGNNTCLLKTAIASVSANSYCDEANILFDEGSQ